MKTKKKQSQPQPEQIALRFGKIDPRYLHISDVDKIIGPHGDGAQEAFDRDASAAYYDEDFGGGEYE